LIRQVHYNFYAMTHKNWPDRVFEPTLLVTEYRQALNLSDFESYLPDSC